jgi:hypothetical protein
MNVVSSVMNGFTNKSLTPSGIIFVLSLVFKEFQSHALCFDFYVL